MAYRTHNCNELTFDNLNERVQLAGWVDTIRDHGGVAFIDLRDEYGVTQVVVNDGDLINHLKKESVISVTGTVVKRDEETINTKIATGELGLRLTSLRFLTPAPRICLLKSASQRKHARMSDSLIVSSI